MKVAFWSSAKGSTGVTSNLACISLAMAIEHSLKTVLIENHYQKNKLTDMLLYHHKNFLEVDNLHNKTIGMDYIINQLSTGKYFKYENPPDELSRNRYDRDYPAYWLLKDSKINQELSEERSKLICEASINILDDYVYYIPNCLQMNQDIFEYTLNENIVNILKASEEFADITYIDTSNQNNLSSKTILEEVDLVVVNLIQNPEIIKEFIDNYSSLKDKSVFLISGYNNHSKLNVNNISKQYSINKSGIATIPYNLEYQEALTRGRLIEFMQRNFECKRNNPNYNFIKSVKGAVSIISRELKNI